MQDKELSELSELSELITEVLRGESERRGEREREKKLHSPFAPNAPIQWAL